MIPNVYIFINLGKLVFFLTWKHSEGSPHCESTECNGCRGYVSSSLLVHVIAQFFFIEHAGELRIFVLREEKNPITFPSPYLGLE